MMTLMETRHGIPYTWNLLRWVSHLMVMMLLNVIMVMVMMMEAQHGMESSEKGEISSIHFYRLTTKWEENRSNITFNIFNIFQGIKLQ